MESVISRQPNLLKMVLFGRLHARIAIALLALVAALFGIASPLFQKVFVDRLMGISDSFTLGSTTIGLFTNLSPLMYVGLSFVCLLLGTGASVAAVWLSVKEGNRVQARIGEMLYAKMLRMRSDQLGNRAVGEITALYATDVSGATLILEEALPMATSTFFPLIVAPVAVHFVAHVPLGTTVLLTIAIICLNAALSYRQSKFFYLFKHLAAERVGIVSEWIQNMRLLRILGWTESFEYKIQKKRIEETQNRINMVTNGQVMSSIGSSISFFINLCGLASLIFLSSEALNPSELLALLWIFGVFLARPFRQIPWMFTMGMDGLTSIRRLEKFLHSADEGESRARGEQPKLPTTPAALEVKGLSLSIRGAPILKDISFSVAQGEWVAVVGEVGSGKTMLLLSLMGEAGAEFSKYEIDGKSVHEWPVDSRRALFAFVPQEGFVMSATLRENVALEYDHGIDKDPRVIESLTRAQFDLRRESVTGGLEAEIGERGVNLSGGQRQRVSLARAEYFNRPILLLDDCLSAVDIETERRLVDNLLDGVWRGRTRVLVTHRLTVLEHVDRVVFLEDGKIEASGKFHELLNRNEKFRKFAATVADTAAAPATVAASESVTEAETATATVTASATVAGSDEDLNVET